jgi:acetyl/propionyl-CoA carboxylase alpha subunit
MEYRLLVDEKEKALTVTHRPAPEGNLALVEGRELRFRAWPIDDNTLLLEVDGRRVPVHFATDGTATHLFIRGETYLVEDQAALRVKRKGQDVARLVTPPMPASVIRILVAEGAQVKQWEALLVVSAMKMESTLAAPYAGRVKKINTTVGAQVKPGDVLVEIEPEKEDG